MALSMVTIDDNLHAAIPNERTPPAVLVDRAGIALRQPGRDAVGTSCVPRRAGAPTSLGGRYESGDDTSRRLSAPVLTEASELRMLRG